MKRVHNEPTEYYFFPIKQVSKLIKIKKHVRLRTKRVRSYVKKSIGHVNKIIQSKITWMHGKELESINVTSTYDKESNNHKETLSVYDNKGK